MDTEQLRLASEAANRAYRARMTSVGVYPDTELDSDEFYRLYVQQERDYSRLVGEHAEADTELGVANAAHSDALQHLKEARDSAHDVLVKRYPPGHPMHTPELAAYHKATVRRASKDVDAATRAAQAAEAVLRDATRLLSRFKDTNAGWTMTAARSRVMLPSWMPLHTVDEQRRFESAGVPQVRLVPQLDVRTSSGLQAAMFPWGSAGWPTEVELQLHQSWTGLYDGVFWVTWADRQTSHVAFACEHNSKWYMFNQNDRKPIGGGVMENRLPRDGFSRLPFSRGVLIERPMTARHEALRCGPKGECALFVHALAVYWNSLGAAGHTGPRFQFMLNACLAARSVGQVYDELNRQLFREQRDRFASTEYAAMQHAATVYHDAMSGGTDVDDSGGSGPFGSF